MPYQIIIAIFALLPALAHAVDRSYSGQENRVIKALSDQEIADYRNGRGMGTSKAAELNHYPGPRHVLDQAQALALSKGQEAKTQEIHDAMAHNAARIGEQIVQKEAQLEELYATGRADADNTGKLVREIAALQAEFRLQHLNAHLSMREVLSQEQIAAYDRLRGYVGTKSHEGGHTHGMTHSNTGRE